MRAKVSITLKRVKQAIPNQKNYLISLNSYCHLYKLNGVEDHIHSIKEKQRLIDYVLKQEEHHKIMSFKEE